MKADFNNATHITCANGLAVPVNPFQDFTSHLNNRAFNEWREWLKDQPQLHCSPELSGTYPVDEFGEVVWQFKELDGIWHETSSPEVDKSVGYEVRLFIKYIGPKKQESEPLIVPKAYYNCSGCEMDWNKENINDDLECPVCGIVCDCVLMEDHPTIAEPATSEQSNLILIESGMNDSEKGKSVYRPEQKGVEQGEEAFTIVPFEIQSIRLKWLANQDFVLIGDTWENLNDRKVKVKQSDVEIISSNDWNYLEIQFEKYFDNE